MNDTSQDINQMHHKNWMQLELLSRKKKKGEKPILYPSKVIKKELNKKKIEKALCTS
jgi:hypothetical protein